MLKEASRAQTPVASFPHPSSAVTRSVIWGKLLSFPSSVSFFVNGDNSGFYLTVLSEN